MAEVVLPFTDQRTLGRRELPRLDLPAAERVRAAVVWYADRIRGRDIATVCKLSIGRLTKEAKAAGVPPRAERDVRADLPLLGLVHAAVKGATVVQLVEQYGISWASALNVQTLAARSHPPKFKPTKTEELPVVPLRRCQSCAQMSRHETECVVCGGAW